MIQRYTWGLGSIGQLGHCSIQYGDKELLPKRVVALDSIVIRDVACGGVHTCAITAEGVLYAWGGGQAGQLGLGPQNGLFSCTLNASEMLLRNLPAFIIPSGVQLVACGHPLSPRGMGGYMDRAITIMARQRMINLLMHGTLLLLIEGVGEVRRLAAGGGHSAVLTDACSLKGFMS